MSTVHGGAAGGAVVVGRDRELVALDRFLEDGCTSLMLTGGPGIGKTTLWQATVAKAQDRGVRVLAARPTESEAQLSFAALVDLLDGLDEAVFDVLPAPQRRALDVALLRADASGTPPEQRAIALAVRNALRAAAEHEPLLVAIDDVQWLDGPSSAALTYAARRLDCERISFLVAKRAGASAPLERTLEPGIDRLELEPLSSGAIRRVLYEQLGLVLPRRLLRRVAESTGGNPLFALELGRSLQETGLPEIGEEMPVPGAVEDLLGTRVAALAGPVRHAVLAVALSGDLRRSQLAAISDAAARDQAADEGLLVVRGDRVRTAHPLVAAAARRGAATAERRALHRRLADVVEDDGLRARHLALATERPDEQLAGALEAVASGAAARGRAEDAVEFAEHALRLTPWGSAARPGRVVAVAEYLAVAGEPQRAAALLLPEIERLPAGPTRARAHLLLGAESRLAATHVDACTAHLEHALAESEGDPELHATVKARLVRHRSVVRLEAIPATEALALEALSEAESASVEREALHGLAWARSLRGAPIDDLLARFGAVSGDAVEIFRSLERIQAERHASRGEVAAAREIFERLIAVADERGEAWSYVRLRLGLCELELRAGEWVRAQRLLDAWLQSPDRELLTAPAYGRCCALLSLGRGDAGKAERWAVRAIEESEALGLRWDLIEAQRVRGLAALLLHEPERAAETLRAAWEHTRREGVDEPGAFPVAPEFVEALAETGEHDEARAVTACLQELAERQEHPWALASVKRSRATVELAESYDAAAAAELAQAASDFRGLGLRFDAARALLGLGRAQRRWKKWGAARESLEAAVSAFDELGSPGWAEQARSELSRVGARRKAPTGELTPAEQRVVQLATAGLANKEIARELFVGVHTVEVHLSHAYAKLGVRSRTQLAGRLAGDS